MPTYGYRCDKGHEFEVFQAMADAPLDKCQVCGAPVRRIFYPVGIVFKGPGFYKTDSRGSSSSTTPAPATAGGGSDSSSPGSDSGGDKSDSGSKPAKKPEKAEKKTAAKPEGKSSSGSAEKKSA